MIEAKPLNLHNPWQIDHRRVAQDKRGVLVDYRHGMSTQIGAESKLQLTLENDDFEHLIVQPMGKITNWAGKFDRRHKVCRK
jgi:hypothetical protein